MAVQPLHVDFYQATLPNISSGTVPDGFVVMSGGTLEKVSLRMSATVTGTAVITVSKNGVTAFTVSLVAPQAGDIVHWTGAVPVAEGDYINFVSDDGSTTTSIAKIGARVRKLTS